MSVGGDTDAPGRFTVSVPARAGLMSTLRTFASAVTRHYGFEEDVVEDVKLAVSEASADPIEAGVDGQIELAIAEDGGALVYELCSDSWDPGATTRPDLPDDLADRWVDRVELVRALFTDAERSERDGRSVLRFSTASRAGSSPT